MKNLLICSPWDNVWMKYYKKFFGQRYNVRALENNPTLEQGDVDSITKEYQAISWADIVLFNWTDPFLQYWSNQPKKKDKKYIAFLRSYELFNTSMPWQTNWNNVDHLIFVNDAIRTIFLTNVKDREERGHGQVFKTPTHFIPNAIDLNEWKFIDRKPNKKIVWISNLTYKKGSQLLLQFADKMPNNYHLYPIGKGGDFRTIFYFEHLKKEMKVKEKFDPYLYRDNVQEFLKDKSFELMTSLVEGHPNAVLEAMAVGMKPIIHNFPGSKNLFPEKYIWNTVDEAVEMLNGEYNSAEYRDFIERNYTLDKVYPQIERLFT